MTITEFLLARIAEDEAATICFHGVGCANQDFGYAPGLTDCNELNVDPRRWSAECEAKQRIVMRHISFDGVCGGCGIQTVGVDPFGLGVFTSPCPELRYLAAVYAEHPDYDQAWTV